MLFGRHVTKLTLSEQTNQTASIRVSRSHGLINTIR